MIFWHSLCANLTASKRTDSNSSSAPPSTMTTALRLAATIKFKVLVSICLKVGFTTKSPFTRPIRTQPNLSATGMSETAKGADAAETARTSESFSWSEEITVQCIWTSLKKPSGYKGRIGRSIKREVKIYYVRGRSSRLNQPPGMRQTAEYLSRYSTVKGKKSLPGMGSLAPTTATRTTVSPN